MALLCSTLVPIESNLHIGIYAVTILITISYQKLHLGIGSFSRFHKRMDGCFMHFRLQGCASALIQRLSACFCQGRYISEEHI